RNLTPRCEGVGGLHAAGNLVNLLQGAVLAGPSMAEAVYDEHVVAGRLGGPDGLDVHLGAERVQVQDVELELVSVQGCAVVLGVRGGDAAVRASEPLRPLQRRVRLATPARADERDAGLALRPLRLLERERHG